MKKILAATADPEIIAAIAKADKMYSSYFDFDVFENREEVIRYIDYELPEIKILDFTSEHIDPYRLLKTICADPWLHNGGIIAVASDARQAGIIEKQKNANILIVQTKLEFIRNFPRLLYILQQNQSFLFSRGMQTQLGTSESGSFICANHPTDIRVYTGFLTNYLYSSNRIDNEGRINLKKSLTELLFNALEHGNCGITYEEKTNWIAQGKNILVLIYERASLPENKKKYIYISYRIAKDKAEFCIRDDGKGFNWKKQLAPSNFALNQGMGIGIVQSLVQRLAYNEKGNQVCFSIKLKQDSANTVPLVISPYKTIRYSDKEVVCRQNEKTNHLFFIVSGKYAVYANNRLLSVLTPKDMFIGEMSFLLNDRRSATIISVGNGKLIKIPKDAFLKLIRKNPHYGIFLAKLLAQRLYEQAQKNYAPK